jgi:hypothetical protein
MLPESLARFYRGAVCQVVIAVVGIVFGSWLVTLVVSSLVD